MALRRVSIALALALVAVEALTSYVLAAGPIGARASPDGWVFLLIAAGAVALLGSPLGTRTLVAAPAALVTSLALGAAAGSGAVPGLGLAFAAVLVTGEALAAAVWIGGGSERLATISSLLAAAVITSTLALFGERLDVPSSALGIGVGGALATVQLALFRAADGMVPLRFRDSDVVAAAAARFSEVPRRALLAAIGSSEPEANA